MLVYLAYSLLVLHVTFGVLQGEGSPVYVVATALGLVTVLGLHLTAAKRERGLDSSSRITHLSRRSQAKADHASRLTESQSLLASAAAEDDYVDACAVSDIPENRARIVCLSGERVAIFKYDGKVSAVSNVCQHQNGPLGEGKIVFGCITCPWHGYQYVPETGASPPPFVEKVPTFNVRVKNGRVFVHPRPNPAGTGAEPAMIEGNSRPSPCPEASGSAQQPLSVTAPLSAKTTEGGHQEAEVPSRITHHVSRTTNDQSLLTSAPTNPKTP